MIFEQSCIANDAQESKANNSYYEEFSNSVTEGTLIVGATNNSNEHL